MSAKEMFDKLGYGFKEYETQIIYNFPKYHKGYCVEIEFDKIMQSYKIKKLNHATSVGIELHKAINQQMIELGWLE